MRQIGLDETGKGEIFGDMVLCGVELDSDIPDDVSKMVWSYNTKRKRPAEVWNKAGAFLGRHCRQYQLVHVRPKDVPQGRTTGAMDAAYIGIIKAFNPGPGDRVVLDDYGVGFAMRRYADSLECEVVIRTKADDKYVEVRAASILAKRGHVNMMDWIKTNPAYMVGGMHPGSGNCGDVATKRWLRAWNNAGTEWPDFVRTWWAPVKKLEAARARRMAA